MNTDNSESPNKKTISILILVRKYRFYIISIILLAIIALVSSLLYSHHKKNLADKNSLVYSSLQENLSLGKTEKSEALIKDLIKHGTNGYKFIATLQQANIYINKKKYSDAINSLDKINKLRVPHYYKDFANHIIYTIRLDHDKNLLKLSTDIQKLNKKNAFYYPNLEIYLITLMELKKYKKALKVSNDIIESGEATQSIKSRVKNFKTVILAYIKK